MAVNEAMSPEPLAGRPMPGALLTQLYTQPVAGKFIAVVALPLVTVCVPCAAPRLQKTRVNTAITIAGKKLLMLKAVVILRNKLQKITAGRFFGMNNYFYQYER